MRPRHVISMIGTAPATFGAMGVLRFLIFGGAPWATGLIVQRLFDQLSGAAPAEPTPLALAGLLVLVALLRGLAVLGDLTGVHVYNYKVAARLRANLLERILERPGAQAIPGSPGEAISRFRDDVREVARFANNSLLFAITESLFVVAALAVMLRISTPITLAIFAPLVLVTALATRLMRAIVRYRRASREAAGQVTSFIGELFSSVQAIQLAAAEGRALARFADVNESRRTVALRDRLYSELYETLLQSTVNLGTGIVLLAAAGAMRDGSFTIGDFALFVTYLGPTAGFVHSIGRVVARYRQAEVSWERLVELLQGAPPERLLRPVRLRLLRREPERVVEEPQHQPAAGPELLALDRLSYRYPGSGRGIESVSVAVPRGALVIVTGRIGSGKTTLLRAALGLLPRDAGEIRWDGVAVDDPGALLVPPRCAYTAQIPRLFSDTLRANILLGLPDRPGALGAAVEAAVLERDLPQLPGGLDALVGSRGVRLSGGQAQRAAAARMFVRQPELLVFDDLSSALDVETEQLLWERLAARRGAGAGPQSILAVSTRRAALQQADWVVLLDEGRLVDQGALADLLERSELMRSLWEHGALPGRAEPPAA